MKLLFGLTDWHSLPQSFLPLRNNSHNSCGTCVECFTAQCAFFQVYMTSFLGSELEKGPKGFIGL